MIRQKKDDFYESGVFSLRTAFMSGGFGDDDEEVELEAVEASSNVFEDDAKEGTEFKEYEIGEDTFFVVF